MRRRTLASLLAAMVLTPVLFWYHGALSPPFLSAAAEAASLPTQSPSEEPPALGVSSLGRLEPKDGIVRVAGPAIPVAVIQELLVEDGEFVAEGQTLAILDGFALLEADVERLAAELDYQEVELRRKSRLHEHAVVAEAIQDAQDTRVRVARARLRRARAELERYRVRAPFEGQVLRIHAHPGERVGEEGILEMGATHRMVAIAEVYETDIPRVRIGQGATVTSPVLSAPLTGRVGHVWPLVAKQDALGTDPAARKDARVVEVEIRLDDSDLVASLSFLQVTVEIHPESSDPSEPSGS